MPSKDDLIRGVIELGAKTGQFSGSKGKDTDLVIEREIVNADYQLHRRCCKRIDPSDKPI
jgi:hypothetical protein